MTEVLELKPIGVVRSPFRERMDAPRQPRAAEGVRGTIELLPGHNFEDALTDLEGFEYIWVLFWFHLNTGWRPRVLPPRSEIKRGLFATRTPYRPNPIGMSALRLEKIDGLTLHVSDLDLLDGTPVLDIKPYVAWTDAIPDAREGWLDDRHEGRECRRAICTPADRRPADPKASYEVTIAPRAAEQLQWLRDRGVDLEGSARSILVMGPQPHAYRRIKNNVLAIHEWRVTFRVIDKEIEIVSLHSGYRAEQQEGVHLDFTARFP
jgi:tRNA (adenine37-N6)-methyltransferase